MFRFWIFAALFLVSSPFALSAEPRGLPDTELQDILSLVEKSDIDGLLRAVGSLDEKYVTTHQMEYLAGGTDSGCHW